MEVKEEDSPSRLIDARIRELGDWRGEALARIRILIHQGDKIDEKAVSALIRAAVALNTSSTAQRAGTRGASARSSA
jgi:hypothetical protein